jgi:hypothetical protein
VIIYTAGNRGELTADSLRLTAFGVELEEDAARRQAADGLRLMADG